MTPPEAMNPPLLFLCHRIPYPPNKGDKIRSYHLLRFLSKHYRVYLGTFIDDQADWDHVAAVEMMCEECCFIRLNPRFARVKSLSGFYTGMPLTVPYYFSRQMVNWFRSKIEQQQISRLVVYSSAMAQYAMSSSAAIGRRVIDFVDIDSDKWRQYALHKSSPMSWVYRREADKLLRFEQDVAAEFDAGLFVSSAEADMFRRLAPGVREKISFYHNGVDSGYFSPDKTYWNPFPNSAKTLVFTGAMDYWPNIDAVCWFAREVFPELRRLYPNTIFYIVGSKPADNVRKLARESGVVVTGRVADVRPYLCYAAAVVVPMRIARGIQNKVLEAMAMERPVVVSGPGLEGINANPEAEILLANSRDDYIRYIGDLFAGKYKELGKKARQRVLEDFNWDENLPLVVQLLENK